jgi:hypothetical protein
MNSLIYSASFADVCTSLVVGATALIFRVRRVVLRCLSAGFGCSSDLVVNSCGIAVLGHEWCVVLCIDFRTVFYVICWALHHIFFEGALLPLNQR